jgi:hypothetical protein
VENIDVIRIVMLVFVLLVIYKKYNLVIVEDMKELLVVVLENKFNYVDILDIIAVLRNVIRK